MGNNKVAGKRGGAGGPKPKMTKAERKAKYTEIARKRRMKQQGSWRGGGGRFGNNRNRAVVCYQCRQTGHTIAECPNKDTHTTTTGMDDGGICYKCGSTEHSLSHCPKRTNRPRRGNGDNEAEELPFATCFLCKQKGHITKSCPQNQHGIYVNGGCCRICGSQNHRATACPENSEKKKKKRGGTGGDGSDDDSVGHLLEPEDPRTKQKTQEKKTSSAQSERNSEDHGPSSVETTKKQNKKRRVVKF